MTKELKTTNEIKAAEAAKEISDTKETKETKEKIEVNFTEGRIFGPLLKFAVPIFLAMLLQVMYGAVDLIVVGQFATTADVSAVSTGSQITQSIGMVIIALSMGLTVVLGQYIGEGNRRKAGRTMGTGIVFFILLGFILTLLAPFISAPLAKLMKAPAEAFGKTVDYVRICLLGSIFVVAFNLLGSILRGIGDSKTPLLSVVIACIFNIGGDVLLVKGFGMGSKGAAIATVAAQTLSVIICFFILKRRELPVEIKKEDLRLNKTYIKNIANVGIPLALQDFLVGISFLVVLSIVNSLGVVVSAGIGVAEKIAGFIILMPVSMSQALSAFVAHNYGAGNLDRAEKALKYAIGIALLVGFGIFYITFFHGDYLAAFFTNGKDVIEAAAEYSKAYAFDAVLTSVLFCYNGYFNGCQRTKFVMAHGIFGAFCVRIPVSFFMSRRIPVRLFYIGLATPTASIIECIMCGIYYIMIKKDLLKKMRNQLRKVKNNGGRAKN